MHYKAKINHIEAKEILDSRGNPTLSAMVRTETANGFFCGSASVPAGASTGKYEAVELRDGDLRRMNGRGCLKAVGNVNTVIAQALNGEAADDQRGIDRKLRELDGTPNKSNLGANAILAVSLACAVASAKAYGLPLWRYLGGIYAKRKFSRPMLNVINGGVHADNSLDFQEFMIVPVGATTFWKAMDDAVAVYHSLKALLKQRGFSTAVGDEGGFAPNLKREEDALGAICDAIEASGLKPGTDVAIALDVAASEWTGDDGNYHLPKAKKVYTPQQLIRRYRSLCSLYPIVSIEDGAGEDDMPMWQALTQRMGHSMMLVGDDLFVTNTERLGRGIDAGIANAVLIKPNQIGTLTETLDTISFAREHGYRVILSHRSGETADTFIADLACAVNADFMKAGAPCRAERTEKYNRLKSVYAETTGDF